VGPVPAALLRVLGTLQPVLDVVGIYVRDRLAADLGGLQPVVIEYRVKSPQSIYHKLQTGRYSSIVDLDDLIGVKVVLLRRSLLAEAQEIVNGCGLTIVAGPTHPVEPTDFRHREPKISVRPAPDYLSRNPDKAFVLTEVQFTTALQHALDMATHDFDYKGKTYSWGNFRLVAQLRGTLELVDRILDDIGSATMLAEVVASPPDRYVKAQALSLVLRDSFASEALPDDMRRMTDTVADWLDAAGLDSSELPDLLKRHDDLTSALSIDPTAAILGALLRERAGDLCARYEGRLPISDELASLCPGIPEPAEEKRVSFDATP
jgi:hypothetical protein